MLFVAGIHRKTEYFNKTQGRRKITGDWDTVGEAKPEGTNRKTMTDES